jgi:hypothetical protein
VAGDKVSLKGAKNCIEGAIARIEEIMQDLVELDRSSAALLVGGEGRGRLYVRQALAHSFYR